MKIDNGYIIGKGNDFFGEKYENLLEKVYVELPILEDNFEIILSKNEVNNVRIIQNDTFAIQNEKKEKFLNNKDIVQFWFQSKTNKIFGTNELGQYCYTKLREFYSNQYVFGPPAFNISIYNNGCFIKNHKDGYDNDDKRLCVIILYLNKDYEKGMGGELIISDENNNKIEIEPKFGNIAILDFITGNLEHEVKKVTSDIFNRKALIAFIMKEKNLNYKEN